MGSFEEGRKTLLEIDFLVTGTMEKGTYEGKFVLSRSIVVAIRYNQVG